MRKSVLLRVDPLFKKEIRKKASELDMNMSEYTTFMMKQSHKQKEKKKGGLFGFKI